VAVANTYEVEAVEMVQNAHAMLVKALDKPLHLDAAIQSTFAEQEVTAAVAPSAGIPGVKGSGVYASPIPAGGYGMTMQMGLGMPADVARKVVNRPMEGMGYAERIKTLTDEGKLIAQQSVAAGLAAGHNGRRIARDMNKRLDRPRWQLERLARTEAQHALIGVQDAFSEQFDDVIAGWTYVATLDTRTCPDCGARDGRFYPKDHSRPELPLHPNCRCAYAPEPVPLSKIIPGVPPSAPEEGTRHALKPGVGAKTPRWQSVPSSMDFETWLSKQGEAAQRVVLGSVARATLFRKGVLDVKQAGTAKASVIKRELAAVVGDEDAAGLLRPRVRGTRWAEPPGGFT